MSLALIKKFTIGGSQPLVSADSSDISKSNPGFEMAAMARFLQDHVKISLFLIFNSILPLTDVFTDSLTSFDLYSSDQPMWSTITFFLMWNPFIVHLLAFLFNSCKSKCCSIKQIQQTASLFCRSKCVGNDTETGNTDTDCSAEKFDATKEFKRMMFFFPYVTPIKNIYYAIKLYRLKFGMQDFEAKNAKEVERIQHQAGSACMYESFLESGPQCVVQLKIILSTGTISFAQMVSIPVSVFSLAWASSRAFFIQRDEDNSDPDPELKTVAIHIFPWMLLVVLHSLTVWTFIAGLLGGYVLHCILVYFSAAYSFQIVENSCTNMSRRLLCNGILISFGIFSTVPNFYALAQFPAHQSSAWMRAVVAVSGILTLIIFAWIFLANMLKVKVHQADESFPEKRGSVIKSVLTSIWLPCVVGTKPFTFFLSSLTSHINKKLSCSLCCPLKLDRSDPHQCIPFLVR